MSIKLQIQKALQKATGEKAVHLETPELESHGDYSTNIVMQLCGSDASSSLLRGPLSGAASRSAASIQSSVHLAKEIVKILSKDKKLSKIVSKIEVAGPGFINFWLSKEALLENLSEVLEKKDGFGKSDLYKDKKIMVEYAHPNTHKQFHIGHLRNIAIGESIARLLEAVGAKVIRTNYQGDVGLHVAKALWGVQKLGMPKNENSLSPVQRVEFLGKAYAKGAQSYEESEAAKKEITTLNIKIYKKDPDIMPLWKKTRQWSLDYFDAIYQRVGTKYDRLYFESEVSDPGTEATKKALKKGVLEQSEGAVVFKGDKYSLHTRVFLTKDGLPTYEGKELGLANLEFSEFGEIDKCLHVVAPEQTSFFEVTFKVEELLNPKKYKGRQYHLKYGFVHLKSGKLSSRKGDVITGPWLLDEAKERVEKILKQSEYSKSDKEKIAELVAVGAVKYSMLLPSLEKDMQFDFDESIALEGNSGPYLQYTYARTQSVLRKSLNSKFEVPNKSKILNNKRLEFEKLDISNYLELSNSDFEFNDEEALLLRSFPQFPELIIDVVKNYSPNLLCNYLFDLAQKYNAFYSKHRIIGNDFRLALTSATGQILANGLTLLGIQTPERM